MPPQEVILATSSSSAFPYAATSSSNGVGGNSSSKRTAGFAPPAFFNTKSTSSSSTTQLVNSSCITLNDLQTGAAVQSYKPSAGGLGSLGWVQSKEGLGGGVFVAQEGKALLTFWSWQKVSTLISHHETRLTAMTLPATSLASHPSTRKDGMFHGLTEWHVGRGR